MIENTHNAIKQPIRDFWGAGSPYANGWGNPHIFSVWVVHREYNKKLADFKKPANKM